MPTLSPCIGVCRIDESSGLCLGCARSRREIAAWGTASPELLRQVWAELPKRRSALGLGLHRAAWTSEDIRSFVAGTMRADGGTWVGGAYGAVAEFCVDADEPVEVSDQDGCLVANTARAAIRIEISDAVRALVFSRAGIIVLAVPREEARLTQHSGFTALGPDQEAVRPPDRLEHLYDFGLGSNFTGFGIRTSDAALGKDLNGCIGCHWPELLKGAGGQIVQVSPARVIPNPIGRIEVFTRIPLPGEQTPAGPHTHFLPALLAAGREMPPGLELPEAYAPCLTYYPARSRIPDDPH